MAKPDFSSKRKVDHLLSDEGIMGMFNIQMMSSGRIKLDTCQKLRKGDTWKWLDELLGIGLVKVDLTADGESTVVCAELTPAGKALLAHMYYGTRGSKIEKEARNDPFYRKDKK